MREGLGSRIVRGTLFERLKSKAAEYLKDPDKLRHLVDRAGEKAESAGAGGPLKGIWNSLMALLRLLRAGLRREYTAVSWPHLVLIVAGLLYFVLPIDVIPDVLLGVGYLDDAAVLGWIVKSLSTVLDDFARWETARPSPNRD